MRPLSAALISGISACAAGASGFDEAPTPSQVACLLLSMGLTGWLAWKASQGPPRGKPSSKRGVASKSPNLEVQSSVPSYRPALALAA